MVFLPWKNAGDSTIEITQAMAPTNEMDIQISTAAVEILGSLLTKLQIMIYRIKVSPLFFNNGNKKAWTIIQTFFIALIYWHNFKN